MTAQDQYDREWLALARPPDYVNPVAQGRYNLVVIGAGTAGLVAATGAVALGARVALIEQNRVGGSRLNVGCIPSKALVRSARAVGDFRRSHGLGIIAPESPQVSFPAVMERMRRLRAQTASADSVARLVAQGIEIFFGEARFDDRSHISVDGQQLAFSRALIATGSSPALPSIPGLSALQPLTNETLFSLTELPPRLAIIGAGPIGCEMAQAFARFGSRVTVYDKEPRILPADDLDPAEMIKAALVRDGIQFRLGCTDLHGELANGTKRLRGQTADGEFADDFEQVLVSSGRTPNVKSLNLDAAHVAYDELGVLVTDHLRTSNRQIFAAGDVCSPHKFTHAADALARTVIANAMFFGTQRVSSLLIPWCTFTDPEIARVGIGEQDTESEHLIRLEIPLRENDRALLDGEEEGVLRIYHDRRGGIHGATLVASHAGEMIGELIVAMRHNVRLGSLASDIHPYPTQSEIFKRAGDQYRRTLLTPTVSAVLKKFLRWRR